MENLPIEKEWRIKDTNKGKAKSLDKTKVIKKMIKASDNPPGPASEYIFCLWQTKRALNLNHTGQT